MNSLHLSGKIPPSWRFFLGRTLFCGLGQVRWCGSDFPQALLPPALSLAASLQTHVGSQSLLTGCAKISRDLQGLGRGREIWDLGWRCIQE